MRIEKSLNFPVVLFDLNIIVNCWKSVVNISNIKYIKNTYNLIERIPLCYGSIEKESNNLSVEHMILSVRRIGCIFRIH